MEFHYLRRSGNLRVPARDGFWGSALFSTASRRGNVIKGVDESGGALFAAAVPIPPGSRTRADEMSRGCFRRPPQKRHEERRYAALRVSIGRL